MTLDDVSAVLSDNRPVAHSEDAEVHKGRHGPSGGLDDGWWSSGPQSDDRWYSFDLFFCLTHPFCRESHKAMKHSSIPTVPASEPDLDTHNLLVDRAPDRVDTLRAASACRVTSFSLSVVSTSVQCPATCRHGPATWPPLYMPAGRYTPCSTYQISPARAAAFSSSSPTQCRPNHQDIIRASQATRNGSRTRQDYATPPGGRVGIRC